jgi:hypothetical protein
MMMQQPQQQPQVRAPVNNMAAAGMNMMFPGSAGAASGIPFGLSPQMLQQMMKRNAAIYGQHAAPAAPAASPAGMPG